MDTKTILAIVVVVGGATLYQASNWWERAYATYESSSTSPDGCIRIDTYKPFWVLPSMFHRIPHPDPTIRNGLGMQWDYPIFKRAYEISTDAFLGETVVFDPTSAHDFIDWGDAGNPGRRIVEANGFPLLDSDHCADEATLANLDAYNKTGKWTIEPSMKAKPSPSGERRERADLPLDSSR
jgi:hypothetical protein